MIIIEPVHEISNNVVCATSKASDQPAHTRSLIRAFASIIVKLLTDHHLEFLCLIGGCRGGYTCQNATLLEISRHGSIICSYTKYPWLKVEKS